MPGYASFLAVDPDTDDTVVVLTNNDEVVALELAETVVESWSAATSAVPRSTDH
jgi:hypothetical protein